MAMAVTVQVKSYTSIGTQWINPGLRGELQMVTDFQIFLVPSGTFSIHHIPYSLQLLILLLAEAGPGY